jgi:hypothetical protein
MADGPLIFYLLRLPTIIFYYYAGRHVERRKNTVTQKLPFFLLLFKTIKNLEEEIFRHCKLSFN